MSKEKVLLKEAASEIRSLRRQNEIMRARLDMFDNMMLLLTTPPNFQNEGMSPDICWTIDKVVEED